jgi:gluconolactonase
VAEEFRVLAEGLNFPEGPAFAPDGALWCVEARGGPLVRWQADKITRYDSGGLPCGLAFDAAGRAWFCDARLNAVRHFTPETGQWQTVAEAVDNMALDRPNDLAFDAAGNLVFTCPGDSRAEPTGSVCCLRPDGSAVEVGSGMYFPNGVVFGPNGRTLMVAETYGRCVWKGEWDPVAARWVNAAPWADLGGEPGPDGMALGADGLLYIAALRAGQVKVVDDAGQVVRAYDVPGPRPTNVAFDPSGALGLVVTEAEHGLLLSLPRLGPGVSLFLPERPSSRRLPG